MQHVDFVLTTNVHTELCRQHSAVCNWSLGVEKETRYNDPISIRLTWMVKGLGNYDIIKGLKRKNLVKDKPCILPTIQY